MLKKLLKILLFPFFIFAFLYGLGEILGILFLATIFYGLLIYAIIQDPTFSLNKLLYFLAVTLAFIIIDLLHYYNPTTPNSKLYNPAIRFTLKHHLFLLFLYLLDNILKTFNSLIAFSANILFLESS